MMKFKRTYTMEEFEKEILYLIRENNGHGIHSLFDKDFMGSCPCASGKLIIEGVEYEIKTHCWKSGISKNGGCTFEVKAKNNKNKQKVISLLKEALDATNWYGEYTLLEDVNKGEKELSCMKCGSKKNLNTNKDKSFVECDECMWDLKSKPEKQENCREKWIRHFKKIEHLLQLGAELGISKEIEDFLSELLKREKPILQMMSDKTFSKEELKVIEEWYDGMLYPTNPDERDKLVHDKLSKLLKEEK